jgi:hypothetical protein
LISQSRGLGDVYKRQQKSLAEHLLSAVPEKPITLRLT